MDKKKILLVDDVRIFLEQEKTFLDEEGFSLLTAYNGSEALKIIMEERPNLVFMDLYMPDMDGDKCCRVVKSHDMLRNIPIVMVTQGVNEEDFSRCWQAGCDDIIVKPINRYYFLAAAIKFLNMERREAPRYAARLRVYYGAEQDTLLADYSINLSTGGLFIETGKFLTVDTKLTIEFILPGNGKTISCAGRVAWLNHPEFVNNKNLPIGMGLQFLNITLDDMNAIREFIKREALTPSW